MSASKCLMIILDGLGDRQFAELDGQTPLQAARTPNLDCLAASGGNGMFHAGFSGQPMPSENAHFALFGYPQELFPGRGPLEALGAGIQLYEGQVAVLAHLVSASSQQGALFVEQDMPAGLTVRETEEIFNLVGSFEHQELEIRLQQTKGLFGVLTLQGPASALITDSNPMRSQAFASNVLPLEEARGEPRAEKTAEAIRAYLSWSYQRLDQSKLNSERRQAGLAPVNGLVTQRAGPMAAVPDFTARTSLKGLSLVSGTMFRGLAKLIGLQTAEIGKQKDVQADLTARLDLARSSLAEYDFIHVHCKAPDEAAHTKDCLAKRDVICALDRALEPYMQLLSLDSDVLTVIAADHSTPSLGPLVHSGEPVPVLMRGKNIRRDQVSAYHELAACCGSLGPIRGMEMMYIILNALDRAKMCGIQEVPHKRLFWPGPAPLLRLEE